MGDPTAKVVFFFNDPSQSLGWSEVWYAAGADINSIQNAAQAVAATRVQILCSPLMLTYCRVSLNLAPTAPGVRRQRLASLTAPLLEGSFRPSSDFSDVAWTAAKIRWANNDGTIFRIQLIRGISDECWQNGNDKLGQQFIRPWVKSYLKQLQAANFQLHHVVRGVPAGSYIALGSGLYEGLTRRATGRPSYLPRGRRSKHH